MAKRKTFVDNPAIIDSRRLLLGAIPLLFALACMSPASASVADPLSVATRSVVVVQTPTSVGTAFVVGRRELLTAAHVVTGFTKVSVLIGRRRAAAQVVRISRQLDIALLTVGTDLEPLVLRPKAAIVGENVYAVGAAMGDLSVTRGIVSGWRDVDGFSHLQTDAAINSGNSGGPLLDSHGRVLGLVVSKLGNAEGIGLAVPASTVRRWLSGAQVLPSNPRAGPTTLQASTPHQDSADRLLPFTWFALPLAGAAFLARSRKREVRVRLGKTRTISANSTHSSRQ